MINYLKPWSVVCPSDSNRRKSLLSFIIFTHRPQTSAFLSITFTLLNTWPSFCVFGPDWIFPNKTAIKPSLRPSRMNRQKKKQPIWTPQSWSAPVITLHRIEADLLTLLNLYLFFFDHRQSHLFHQYESVEIFSVDTAITIYRACWTLSKQAEMFAVARSTNAQVANIRWLDHW